MNESGTKVVLSGVQPTGDLHIGNYLGAIKKFVKIQSEFDCFFCVVDLHAITVFQDPKVLKKNTLEVAATYLASGIDPNKNTIFNQSSVPCHAELAWILNCVCRVGWLNRMTQFKDKAGKDKENASTGLYIYPNLMAADILIYKATHVPVGSDQKQHLELTRDIAQKFNNDFGCEDFFPLPEPMIDNEISRIMSLKDASKKMSKSEPSDFSRIILTDTADQIRAKIKKAKTADVPMPDTDREVTKLKEVSNLINIYSSLSDTSRDKIINLYQGKNFSDFKNDLTDILIKNITPIGNEMGKLMNDQSYLVEILKQGSLKAYEKAKNTINEVYDIVGLIR